MSWEFGYWRIGAFQSLSEDAPPSQKVKDMAHVMLLCYNAGAIKYAVQTCEPATSIITAVYGRCDGLERDFKHAVELEHRNNPLFSDALLNEIRKSVEPKLYALILDIARVQRTNAHKFKLRHYPK